jgi:hypothetical protein
MGREGKRREVRIGEGEGEGETYLLVVLVELLYPARAEWVMVSKTFVSKLY